MSMNLALFYRHAISRPLESLRRRVGDGSASVVARESAPAVAAREAPCPHRHDAAHFERIATYARAGYFNMGYTLDVFHVSE
ncbi:hypothetical protein [Paraburkholderia kururiensis]|uniref:Uncharacterized protein n=1 Tax=Paraburkholderia kururiensis TaxID=984307 RepID=A0ABZ0WJ27_9BURK|nr:hypothetical protein [Paraburkholderia kururiensis]WQD77331.1 hypothetical protein U0042_25280 [Paraburkholderia kururiensis]